MDHAPVSLTAPLWLAAWWRRTRSRVTSSRSSALSLSPATHSLAHRPAYRQAKRDTHARMPPKGTQGMSSKRIAKELTDLNKPDALPQGCSAAPITDDNVHEWRATIGESSLYPLYPVVAH